MYLHLGNDSVINEKKIIGIFDIENTSVSKDTRQFLAAFSKHGKEIDIGTEMMMPRSFVLCEESGKNEIYISPISAQTIKKRNLKIQENPLKKD